MRIEGLNFPEAIESLARRYGVTLPERAAKRTWRRQNGTPRMRANQTAAEFFVHVLWKTTDGAMARDYLAARGIAAETARAFVLGFAPERPANLARALEKRGLTDGGGAPRAGQAGRRRDFMTCFARRLMFPIRDGQGRVLAFGGRVLDQRLPKYINSPESPPTRSRAMSTASRSARGDRHRRSRNHRRRVPRCDRGMAGGLQGDRRKSRYSADGRPIAAGRTTDQNVLACFDGDAAGRKASLRALEIFLAAGLLGRGIFIPPGFDPDTFIKQRGAQAFAELIASADLLADYFLAEQAAAARGSLEGRARAASAVAEVLKAVSNAFEFDLLARKAADALGVGEEVLRAEARRPARGGAIGGATRGTGAAARPPSAAAAGAGDGATAAEVGLLAVALLHPELRGEIAAHVAMLEDAAVAAALGEVCASDEPATVLEVRVAERLDDPQRSRLSAFAVGPLMETAAQALALAHDFADALARRRQQRAMDATRRAAASASSDDEAMGHAQEMIALRRRGR